MRMSASFVCLLFLLAGAVNTRAQKEIILSEDGKLALVLQETHLHKKIGTIAYWNLYSQSDHKQPVANVITQKDSLFLLMYDSTNTDNNLGALWDLGRCVPRGAVQSQYKKTVFLKQQQLSLYPEDITCRLRVSWDTLQEQQTAYDSTGNHVTKSLMLVARFMAGKTFVFSDTLECSATASVPAHVVFEQATGFNGVTKMYYHKKTGYFWLFTSIYTEQERYEQVDEPTSIPVYFKVTTMGNSLSNISGRLRL